MTYYPNGDIKKEISRMCRENRPIDAIRCIQNDSGMGLADARVWLDKFIIDSALDDRHRYRQALILISGITEKRGSYKMREIAKTALAT